jgi:uncharacterized cupin superfamily protein
MKTVFLSRSWMALMLAASLSVALLSAGCDDDEDEDDGPKQTSSTTEKQTQNEAVKTNAETIRLVNDTEPSENAYTVKVPEGWKNTLALTQVYEMKRALVTAVKPGDGTFLFLGDPTLPGFAEPTPQMNASTPLANSNPGLKFRSYTPAKTFFTEYLTNKFGKLGGFRIVGTAPNPRLEQAALDEAHKRGMTPKVTACMIAFDYRDNGKLIRSLINGLTLKIGTIWVADLNGVSTTDDPTQYNDLLLQMAKSFKTDPDWQAQQMRISQERHEAIMAQIANNTAAMTRRHEANMAWIRNSSAAHQARMDALHAQGDAQMATWKSQQAQNDASHEQFLNYIKGEETVVNSGGSSFQVQTGQNQYFRNKNDNTFVGTDSTKELEDLRKIWGLNPDDYENVRIKQMAPYPP